MCIRDRANEKRALLEIDHERQLTVKTQQEILQLRESSHANNELLRAELAASNNELAETRQKLGIAEGKQAELRTASEQQIGDLCALRLAQAKLETQLALLQREVEQSHAATRQLQSSTVAKSTIQKRPRRNRKCSKKLLTITELQLHDNLQALSQVWNNTMSKSGRRVKNLFCKSVLSSQNSKRTLEMYPQGVGCLYIRRIW